MREWLKVEGYPDLIKHSKTGMILNINKQEIEKHRKARKERDLKNQELENLKSDVQEIKALLHKLLENGQNAN